MKRIRTKGPVNYQQQLANMSVMLSRAQLAARLGNQYGSDRNVYQALGYPTSLAYDQYYAQYERQDIAKAIIDRPIKATWNGDIKVVQIDQKDETDFEKAWKDIWSKLQLKSKLIRLDKLSCIGDYGVLLLGLDDVKRPDDWIKPVTSGTRKLLYVKPLGEDSAQLDTYETNPNNERYGLPTIYNIGIKNPDYAAGQQMTISQQIRVHYSRVLHVTGELLESEFVGVPVLQAVYNRLMDLEKLVGASAEMFWRGARPGYTGVVDKEFTLTDPMKVALQEQLDEYEHNLRRFLVNQGIDISALDMQVADPINHVDIQLQMISAVTGIPKRILIGSERGELASTEDKGSWLELIQERQKNYAEMRILRPLIDFCIKYNMIPNPSSPYTILWPDVFAPSEKERALVGQIRASALQSYMNNPTAEIVVPPEIFYQYFLGLEDDDIEYIKKLYKDVMTEEHFQAAQDAQAAKALAAVQPQGTAGTSGGGNPEPSPNRPARTIPGRKNRSN
jgi:hypothetical protein